jgi:hypothetical protein
MAIEILFVCEYLQLEAENWLILSLKSKTIIYRNVIKIPILIFILIFANN